MSRIEEPQDEALGAVLRRLPRPKAGEDFTDRLLNCLDHEDTAPGVDGRRWWWMASAAAAVVFVLGFAFFLREDPGAPPGVEKAKLEQLRIQHQQIEAELAALRQHLRDTEPVLYLEGVPIQRGQAVDLLVEVPLEPRHASYTLTSH